MHAMILMILMETLRFLAVSPYFDDGIRMSRSRSCCMALADCSPALRANSLVSSRIMRDASQYRGQ